MRSDEIEVEGVDVGSERDETVAEVAAVSKESVLPSCDVDAVVGVDSSEAVEGWRTLPGAAADDATPKTRSD